MEFSSRRVPPTRRCAWASTGAAAYRRHVGDLAASIRPPRPRAASSSLHRASAWQHINPHKDCLRREVLPHIVRTRAFETTGNLLRATRPQPGVWAAAVADGVPGWR